METAGGTRRITEEDHYMNGEDRVIVVLYFLIMISVALWALQRTKSLTAQGFYMGSKTQAWPLIGLSLFSNNVGGDHFIGLPAAGALNGIAISAYEFAAVYALIMLGWLFMPVYIAAQVYTVQEYMHKRLGRQRIRILLAVTSSFIRVVTKIMTNLYGGALYFRHATSISRYLTEVMVLIGAAFLTMIGGIEAIIWTDLVQTIMMISGATVVMAISFRQIGGQGKIFSLFEVSNPNRSNYIIEEACNVVDSSSTQLFLPVSNPYVPWTGIFFGMPITTLWYWCVDQMMVQKVLDSPNITHAKSAVLLVAFLKLFSLHFLVIPGMIARVLFTEDIGCGGPKACRDICENTYGCSDFAYPVLVTELLPHGLQGFMVTVLLSALVTSLTAVFNSTSMTFTVDIWPRFRPRASQTEKLLVGRIFMLVLVVSCLALVPVFEKIPGGQIFVYANNFVSSFSPPMVSVCLLAIFWERLTEPAAFWSLSAGLLIGFIRICSQFILVPRYCGQRPRELGSGPLYDALESAIHKFHHLHFATVMFLLVTLVAILVSLFTSPVPKAQLYRLTYWKRHSKSLRAPSVPPISTTSTGLLTARPLPPTPAPTERRFRSMFRKSNPSDGSPTVPPPSASSASSFPPIQVDTARLTPREEIRAATKALEELKWKRINDAVALLLLTIVLVVHLYYGFYHYFDN